MKLVIAASAAVFLFISTSVPAYAGKNVAGNSGNVKTHNLSESNLSKQNSKISGFFNIHGSKYASISTGTWAISAKPWKSNLVLSGTWKADANGQFTTSALNLPKGHYKLFVSLTGQTSAKHKVFKVTEAASAYPAPVIASGTVLTKLPETGPLGLGHVLSLLSLSLGLALKSLRKLLLGA